MSSDPVELAGGTRVGRREFLAVELPPELHQEVETWISACGNLAGWRWVRSEAWHVTLRFLGRMEPERHGRAVPAWARAAAGVPPFAVRLGQVGCFPPRGEPRVLWVALEELPPLGRLTAIASALEAAARELGFAPESRPFRPHVTLARRASSGRPKRPEGRDTPGLQRAGVDRIVLFESRIGGDGARYTALDRFSLGGPDRPGPGDRRGGCGGQ